MNSTELREALEIGLGAAQESYNHAHEAYGGKDHRGRLTSAKADMQKIESAISSLTQQPPCKGAECGSTDPRFHSYACFREHEAVIARCAEPPAPVAWRIKRPDGTYAFGDWAPLIADGDEVECLYAAAPVLLPAPADVLRDAVRKFIADYDQEGFGCACEPNRKCGPCTWDARLAPLRAALGATCPASPEVAQVTRNDLRHLVDHVWGTAHEDESVPSTADADKMIDHALGDDLFPASPEEPKNG